MKFFLKTTNLSLLLLALTTLASCTCGDREERQAAARERQGLILANTVEVVQESEGARLYREKTCNTCHGADGIVPLLPSYPVLAQQNEEYVLQQMLDIQSGARAAGQTAAMKPVVQNVTKEEFAILAKFISTELGAGKQIGAGNADPESPGGKLFKSKTCVACHGKDGKTPILKTYPKIAGHGAEYIKMQMMDIKNGNRANSQAVLGMKGIMHLVSEEEVAQLADYVSSLTR